MSYSSTQFSYKADTKTFTAEASELGRGVAHDLFMQIYPDSCDEGLKIRSDLTDREARFYIKDIRRNNDGDIEEWILYPTSDALKQNPGLQYHTVHVIND